MTARTQPQTPALPDQDTTAIITPLAEGSAELLEAAERYATLRDTRKSIEDEMDDLAKVLRASLVEYPSMSVVGTVYRLELQISTTNTYPVDAFRRAFGDDQAFRCATIDRKTAELLAKQGEIDPVQLKTIAFRTGRTPSLRLVLNDAPPSKASRPKASTWGPAGTPGRVDLSQTEGK